MLIDTHCHLFCEDYDNIEEVLAKAHENGVEKVIVNGCDLKSNRQVLELIDNELKKVQEQQLDYPCTKLIWSPNINKSSTLAASSDCIKLYNYIRFWNASRNS